MHPLAHLTWFIGIVLLCYGWMKEEPVLFAVGFLLAVVACEDLREADESRIEHRNPTA